jgi:C-terminal processing protease CtpA/Prc
MRTLLAFMMAGAAVVAPGAIALAASQSAPAPMSPEANAYLDKAIELFREQHINSSKMDWPALTQKAYAAAAGAKTSADTYPAIRLIIQALGEKHTNFMEPDRAKADATGKPSGNAQAPALMLPEGMRLANGIGVIRLYGFMGSPEQGKAYAEAGEAKIAQLKAAGVCKFVVDLRFDQGGNMYPMITALSGLLHDGVLGTFENAQGKLHPWVLKNGIATEDTQVPAAPQPTRHTANSLPVAVLLGPMTMSSGEYTAISFEGRANTRFFGAPSGGYVTANTVVPLSDGAAIVMTVAWGHDRTGKKYTDRIEPDENTGSGGAALDAAVKWLSAQHCPAAARHAASARRR